MGTQMNRDELVELCRAHGIDDAFWGIDGVHREAPTETLAALVEAFDIRHAQPTHRATIEEALHESDPPSAFVPDELRDARAWGFACQLGSLRSQRNAGIGDFEDLRALVRSLAEMGADFIGLNPLHALFTANPHHASPFSPSNRSWLNPIYIAIDQVPGFDKLPHAVRDTPAGLREGELIDLAAVAKHKLYVLRALHDDFPWDTDSNRSFARFRRDGDSSLQDHALFEAISHRMVATNSGAGWTSWPEGYRDRNGIDVLAFETAEAEAVTFHAWLQWIADIQLGRAAREAREAGMRVGLYLDLAVGSAPDGSATWGDRSIVVPGLHIGAPPDPFSATGQDWGLAPISPVALAERDAKPIADMLDAVMRHAGAVRIDHAMGLARLWLIPAGRSALDGAYVRYPLTRTLAALSAVTNRRGCIVIGEDLGVVPDGFRPLMERRDLHAYKVFQFERDEHGFRDPATWGRTALACVGTHDTPSFPGWWAGHDIGVRQSIGQFTQEDVDRENWTREEDRNRVRGMLGHERDLIDMSLRVHAHVARSPCRLAVVQIDDALGTLDQPNMPGTIDEHPNWRRRMAVPVDQLASNEGMSRHAEAMRAERARVAA